VWPGRLVNQALSTRHKGLRRYRGQDEGVGVGLFGWAEFGQQVQVVAEGLQLLVGFFRQVVAGLAWRSVSISIK
jgi:hypothetical protein